MRWLDLIAQYSMFDVRFGLLSAIDTFVLFVFWRCGDHFLEMYEPSTIDHPSIVPM
jgi:hypothetical protein